jgi:Hg(II)-responsive transcriptional regulator
VFLSLDLILRYKVYIHLMARENFTIGELAKRAGINAQTVRYYERRRMMSPNSRSAAGYRFYTSAELKRVLFIKNAQELGFTLKEIQELLDLRTRSSRSCTTVRKRAEAKLKSVQSRIATLQMLERVLLGLVSDCERRSASSACPIIDRIEEA